MALRIGQIIWGARWNYLLVEALADKRAWSNVFKAEIIPRVESHIPGKWAVIKTSSETSDLDMLKHEHSCYTNPVIRTSPNFRTMYESINSHTSLTTESPYCLAFEWMDCTLEDVPCDAHRHNVVLHKSISKTVLGALSELKSQSLVHSDIKGNNVLISDVDGPSPVVKLGDLGLLRREGFDEHPVQPLTTRAPEVWSGLGCFHSSDVWSLAVMLFNWLRPGVFGSEEVPWSLYALPWAIAKLLRLFPGSVTPHPSIGGWQDIWRTAQMVEQSGCGDSTDEKCIETLSFEEELTKLDAPPELLELLRYMLVVDYKRRPTALDVLNSQQFQFLGGALASRL